MFHCLCCGTRNWTDWDDGLHPSIQSPTVNIFDYRISQNKGLFSSTVLQFWFLFLMIFSFCTFVIFFCSERGIVSMMLIFCWNFSMIYLFVICQWYIRFAIWMFILQQVCSFAQQVDLFSVRDFIISILIIFSFLR